MKEFGLLILNPVLFLFANDGGLEFQIAQVFNNNIAITSRIKSWKKKKTRLRNLLEYSDSFAYTIHG